MAVHALDENLKEILKLKGNYKIIKEIVGLICQLVCGL